MTGSFQPAFGLKAVADPRFPIGRRGERPLMAYVPWETSAMLEQIPGVYRVPGGAHFSWDAFGPVCKALNVQQPWPLPTSAGVPVPGLDEFKQLNLHNRLRPYQAEMAAFLMPRSFAIDGDPPRCLSGKTRISTDMGAFKLEELICILDGTWTRQGPYGPEKWASPIPRPLSYDVETCSFIPNKIVAGVRSGVKRCFRLVASLVVGTSSLRVCSQVRVSEIIASADHQFLTPRDGYKSLNELRPGDRVLGTIANGRRVYAVPFTVDRIEERGEVETFDLSMEGPHNNFVADGFVVHNSGKTPTLIASAVARGAKKILIVCPSLVKYVWAEQIHKFTGQPSLILEGLSADSARMFCVACAGRGSVGDKKCTVCAYAGGRGWAALFNGADECRGALKSARWVISNYDILAPIHKRAADGVKSLREGFGGWMPMLAQEHFEIAILDEVHLMRGRPGRDRGKLNKRDYLTKTLSNIETVWGATGTSMWGYVRDLWGVVDVVTDGLFGRPFFKFDARHCLGTKIEGRGWQNKGTDYNTLAELNERRDTFVLKRPRKELYKFLPAKERQQLRFEADAASVKVDRRQGSSGLAAALRRTAQIKVPYVVPLVVDDLCSSDGLGEDYAKVIIFTFLKDNAHALHAALVAACKSKEVAPRVRSINLNVWCVTGETPNEARFKQAQVFREWKGAAAFIATMDSVPVGISLKGAQTVYYNDLHHSPAVMLQSEDRAYDADIGGLAILYPIVSGSVDEHMLSLLLPKMEALERAEKDEEAGQFRAAFGAGTKSDEDVSAEVWARIEAAAEQLIDVG